MVMAPICFLYTYCENSMILILCIKQVEYQLSDMTLLANESLSKQISKDPEGYGKETYGSSSCSYIFN